jgi:RNA-directed DNA polymerase
VASTDRKRQPFKTHVAKYAEDFIITGTSKAILQHQARPAIEAFLKEQGLEFFDEKSHITHISQGYDFLGQNVRKYVGKLLIMPARKSVKPLLDKLREITNGNKVTTQANLILAMNPVIRSWPHVSSPRCHRQAFRVGRPSDLASVMVRGCPSARHEKCPLSKTTMLSRSGPTALDFASREKVRDMSQLAWLFAAASVSIVRHIKICSATNLFDSAWTSYLESRRAHRQVARRHSDCWKT